jgi:hypothetical protein
MSNPENALPRWFWYAATLIIVPTVAFVLAFLLNPQTMVHLLVFYPLKSYQGHP